jgi:hypothetical protein
LHTGSQLDLSIARSTAGRGDPGADPIAAIDCALAVQAAEAVVEREALNAPALPA